MLPHPISLQVLPQLAGVPQLNLLCHPCPSHKFSLSPAQLTKTQSERWSHFSWRNSAYHVSSIGVSSCYSFLNQKWRKKKTIFWCASFTKWQTSALKAFSFLLFSVCINKHSGYNEFTTFKQFFKSLLVQNCPWMSTQTPFSWSSFSPMFLFASSPH